MRDTGAVPRFALACDTLNCVVLFLVIVVSCSYFFTGGGWNQASRFDLVRAIIDKGTLAIDDYGGNTEDKAEWNGHYYSDKAPGTALLAVPFVAVAKQVARKLTDDQKTILMAEARVGLLVCASIPTALAALAIYQIARRLACARRAAAIAALSYGLGTPAWAYGTFFWGHALSAACLILAFAAALELARLPWSKLRIALNLCVGLCAAWAVVTEFTATVAAAILAVLVLTRSWHLGLRRWVGAAGLMALGALGPIVILGSYNQLAFGSPLHFGYSSVVGFEGMKEGLWGITYPKFELLEKILIGKERGFLLLSPVLALAPIGLYKLIRDPARRTVGVTATGVFVYYLLLNASYHYWDGGFSYGPRHLAAGLPFLCLGLATPWYHSRIGHFTVKALAIISVSLTLVAMATHPMTPPVEWPLREIFFPGINEAHLSQNEYGLFNSGATPAVNLGELAGLHGLLSLVPLLLFWYSAAKVWNRIQYGRRLRVTWFDAPEATRSLPGRIAEPSHRNEPMLLRCDRCDRRRLDSVRGQRTIVSTRRG